MSFYIITSPNRQSARHPFLGYGRDLYDRNLWEEIDGKDNYKLLQDFGAFGVGEGLLDFGGPFVQGVLTGATTYTISRAMGVDNSKAMKVGIAVAALDTMMRLLTGGTRSALNKMLDQIASPTSTTSATLPPLTSPIGYWPPRGNYT